MTHTCHSALILAHVWDLVLHLEKCVFQSDTFQIINMSFAHTYLLKVISLCSITMIKCKLSFSQSVFDSAPICIHFFWLWLTLWAFMGKQACDVCFGDYLRLATGLKYVYRVPRIVPLLNTAPGEDIVSEDLCTGNRRPAFASLRYSKSQESSHFTWGLGQRNSRD